MNGEQSSRDALRHGSCTVGVISDTHGWLRAEAVELLRGVDRILHAGDVGDLAILAELESLAPVTAVWGNMDDAEIRQRTAEVAEGDLHGLSFAMIHGHQILPPYDRLEGRFPTARLVVFGHSHLPFRRAVGDVLLVNPGSAGPRRPGKPVSLAMLRIFDRGSIELRHLDLVSGRELRVPGA
ncbi:MAG: metallophosphoesterase family protein [Gemmatimonadota bacterium]